MAKVERVQVVILAANVEQSDPQLRLAVQNR